MKIKTLEKRYEFSKYIGDKFVWFAVENFAKLINS